MSLPVKPSRLDFDNLDRHQIERILRTGDLQSLTDAEREYFNMMELVRGLRARMMLPGGTRVVTKAAIIKILKSDAYGLSDWMARQVYTDAINFFYSDEGVRPRAWANLYAEKLEKWADLSASMGKLKEARSLLVDAAKLRGCFDDAAPEIPSELLNAAPVIIYTTDPQAMGAPKEDRRQLEAYIDSLPDIPEVSRQRIKEDAGVKPMDLMARMISDVSEFGADDE